MRLSHYVDPTGQTVLVKETGLSPQESWMGWEISARGVKGRWEGKEGRRRGVSQHAAPLGRRAVTSKALPPSYSLQKVHVVQVERDRPRISDIRHKGAPSSVVKAQRKIHPTYQAPPNWSVSC